MTRARSLRLALVALALLGLGWSLAPRSAPPLYDGVGFPDEPYRFVVKPVGAHDTKPATLAHGTASVSGGRVGAITAASAEKAPQVTVRIPAGRLTVAAGTSTVTITARPVQPVAAPPGKFLWSNVYEVTGAPGTLTLRKASPPATIKMRAATAQRPYPVIERYTGSDWTALKTVPAGTDIYTANLPALGRYAVIGTSEIAVSQLNLGGAQPPASNLGIIIALAAVVIVIVLFIIGERRRSRKRKAKRAAALEARRGSGADATAKEDSS